MLPAPSAPEQRGDRERDEPEQAGLRLLPEDELRDREQALRAGGGEQDPGVGLESMRARAEEVGGGFAIAPAPGGGTRVSVRLPL